MRKTTTFMLAIALLLVNLMSVGNTTCAASTVPAAQSADALLQMLPDSNGVFAVNVAQLNRQIQGLLADKADAVSAVQAHMDRLAAETGVDVRSIEQLVIGISISGEAAHPEPVVLVSGTFNQDQILAKLNARSGKKWKAKKYKGQRIYAEPVTKKSQQTDRTGSISFFDNQTTVAFGPMASVRKVVDTRAGSQPSALQNAGLMTAFNQANSGASIRFAFTISEEVRQKLNMTAGPLAILRPLSAIREVIGSVDLGEAGLLANVSLSTGSDAEATEVTNLINTGLMFVRTFLSKDPKAELLLALLNTISHTQAGNAVNVTVNVPASLISRLIEEHRNRVSR